MTSDYLIQVTWEPLTRNWSVSAAGGRPITFGRKVDAVRAAKDKAIAAGICTVVVRDTSGQVSSTHRYGPRDRPLGA